MYELLKHKPQNRQQRRVVSKLTGEELYEKLTKVAVESWVLGVEETMGLLQETLNEELGIGKKRYARVEENLKSKLDNKYGKD